MFEVPKAAWSVFQRGKAVADPAAWKSYAMAAQMLLGLFTAVIGLLRANGYDLPITDETLQYLAGGIAGLWFGGFGVYRVITDPNRGLPPRGAADHAGTDNGDGK